MTCDRLPRQLNTWTAVGFALLVIASPAIRLWGSGGSYLLSGHASATSGVSRLSGYPRGDCVHCHDPHTDPSGAAYLLFAEEENACWGCHDGGTTYAADAKSPYSLPPANTSTDYYKHPTSGLYSGSTPSTHRWGETAASAFATGNRHAECADCHNPHAAQNNGTPGSSVHTPEADGNKLSEALLGVTGVVVSAWQSAGQPFSSATYSLQTLTSTTTNYEYELCFKCHSTFTTLPTYSAVGSGEFEATKITSTHPDQVNQYQDVGQAFNPNNKAFHPVTAVGKNTNIPAGSFVSPWDINSLMYCSDCHNRAQGSAGDTGPHGSNNMHILERQQSQQETGSFYVALCTKCHRYETYVSGTDPVTNTNFRDGTNKNLHNQHENNTPCYGCHDSHGANNPHLINFKTPQIQNLSGGTRDTYTMWETLPSGSTPDAATGGSCFLNCKKNHSDKQYLR